MYKQSWEGWQVAPVFSLSSLCPPNTCPNWGLWPWVLSAWSPPLPIFAWLMAHLLQNSASVTFLCRLSCPDHQASLPWTCLSPHSMCFPHAVIIVASSSSPMSDSFFHLVRGQLTRTHRSNLTRCLCLQIKFYWPLPLTLISLQVIYRWFIDVSPCRGNWIVETETL